MTGRARSSARTVTGALAKLATGALAPRIQRAPVASFSHMRSPRWRHHPWVVLPVPHPNN